MFFRAFLDDYSDNFNANWNEFTYNGRGESLYSYGGFKRDINFSFKIAAQSRHEMMPIYRKLNFLCAQTAPDYGSGTRMRGPYVKLTIGSLVDRTPGFINSVGLSWQKDYPWEINIDGPEQGGDKEMQVLPHVLDVSVSFQPIHNFLPQKSVTESPFIFPHHDNRDGMVPPLQKWGSLPAMPPSFASMLGAEKLQMKHSPSKIEPKAAEPLPVETDMDPILATATYPPPEDPRTHTEIMNEVAPK